MDKKMHRHLDRKLSSAAVCSSIPWKDFLLALKEKDKIEAHNTIEI